MTTVCELEKQYEIRHLKSRQLYERALNCYASGVSHDARFVKPFPIYAVKAIGTKKWDVDGNEYVDYVMSHGGLLFGYGDPRVLEAFKEQIPKAIHMGSCTELEIEWAELIKELVPCAHDGFVRACGCGGEAVMMAIRLSRSYTGRDKVVLQAGAYHGKGDIVALARHGPPFGLCNSRGIPRSVMDNAIIVPFNNLEAVEQACATGDVSCVLLHCNNLYTQNYIEGLRKITRQYDVVFIMDEVISGFRYAAGGAQEYYGVTPDLAVLGKIIGGGAPVGAICGKKEIMEFYAFKDDAYWNKFVRIAVGGTWNAQPLTIIGGITMMKIIAAERGRIYPSLYKIGKRLIKSFNDQADENGVTALATGMPTENPTFFKISLFNKPIPQDKVYLWKKGPETLEDYETKQGFMAERAAYAHYLALTNNNVHAMSKGLTFYTCTKLTEEDLEITEDAFSKSLKVLRENKLVGLAR